MTLTKSYEFNEIGSCRNFSFNKTFNRIAVSNSTEDVFIFKLDDNKWVQETVLKQHSELVTGIDWAPNTNRIVTCAADRNAYVWIEEKAGTWKQELVLLRINKAATCVKWSPLENKFVCGTGNKLICICYYEEENNWWVSRHIKKPLTSTILSVDWHPNNCIIACGSTDFYMRVFCAAIKETDKKKPDVTNWGDKIAFGHNLCEFKTGFGGWVHSVKFSPSGDQVVWVTHDSTICVTDCSSGSLTTVMFKLKDLPLMCCTWLSATQIFAAGFECQPFIFEYKDKKIISSKAIEQNSEKKAICEQSALNKFKSMEKTGQTTSNENISKTVHTNTILNAVLVNNSIVTSGLDHRLCYWF